MKDFSSKVVDLGYDLLGLDSIFYMAGPGTGTTTPGGCDAGSCDGGCQAGCTSCKPGCNTGGK